MNQNKSDVVGCCGHLVGDHDEDGCNHGWEWDSHHRATKTGCECAMRPPSS